LKISKPTEGVEIANGAPEGRYTIPYRDRLLRRLGSEYRGAERYRLEADRKKEVHWKKWGPYLSDRQWVCPLLTLSKDLGREYFPAFRQLFGRIIPTMVTLGTTSPTSTHVPGPIDGEKMVLLVSLIITNACVWGYRYGTARIISSKNGFSVLPAIRVIMARMLKNSTGILTRHRHIPT
jgi:hypothetical protein